MKKLIIGLLFFIFTMNANATSDEEKFDILYQKIISLMNQSKKLHKVMLLMPEQDQDDIERKFWYNISSLGGKELVEKQATRLIYNFSHGTKESLEKLNKEAVKCADSDDFRSVECSLFKGYLNGYKKAKSDREYVDIYKEYLDYFEEVLREEPKFIDEMVELIKQIQPLIISLSNKGHPEANYIVAKDEKNVVKKIEFLLKATRSKNYWISGDSHYLISVYYTDPDYLPRSSKDKVLKTDMKKAMYHLNESCNVGFLEGCRGYNKFKKKGYSE